MRTFIPLRPTPFPYLSLLLWAVCFVLALFVSPIVGVFAANWPKVTRLVRAALLALGVALFVVVIVWDCGWLPIWLCTF